MAKFEKTLESLRELENANIVLETRLKDEEVPAEAIKVVTKRVKALGVAIRVLVRRRKLLLGEGEADLL